MYVRARGGDRERGRESETERQRDRESEECSSCRPISPKCQKGPVCCRPSSGTSVSLPWVAGSRLLRVAAKLLPPRIKPAWTLRHGTIMAKEEPPTVNFSVDICAVVKCCCCCNVPPVTKGV